MKKKSLAILNKIRNQFAIVNNDESGAETVQMVLLTTFFVLVVAGVVFLLNQHIKSVKVNESFTSYESVTSSAFVFGS